MKIATSAKIREKTMNEVFCNTMLKENKKMNGKIKSIEIMKAAIIGTRKEKAFCKTILKEESRETCFFSKKS